MNRTPLPRLTFLLLCMSTVFLSACSIIDPGTFGRFILDALQVSSRKTEEAQDGAQGTQPEELSPFESESLEPSETKSAPDDLSNRSSGARTSTQPESSSSSLLPSGLRAPVMVRETIRAPLEPPVVMPKVGEFIEPGTLIVGRDIQPGLYYGKSPETQGFCTWIRMSDEEFKAANFIAANDTFSNFYVEVQPSDVALYTTCPVAPVLEMPDRPDIKQAISPGTYLVGIDVQPGRYVFDAETTPGGREFCIVKVLSGFSHISSKESGKNNVIRSDLWYTGRFFVDVPQNAYALQTDCYGRKTTEEEDRARPSVLAEWRKPFTPPPSGLKYYRKGIYSTREMPPGMYKGYSDPDSPHCVVIRYRGDKEVSYSNFYGDFYFEVLEGDTSVILDKDSCWVVPLEQAEKPVLNQKQERYLAGMYLVNYDLPPGKYRVETAYVPGDACTVFVLANMARSNLTQGEVLGAFEFKNGEYFFEILPSDVGVDTMCVIERVN